MTVTIRALDGTVRAEAGTPAAREVLNAFLEATPQLARLTVPEVLTQLRTYTLARNRGYRLIDAEDTARVAYVVIM